MDNVFEELNKLYEDATKYPTLLDVVRCSTVVIVNDAREFTHADAERVAARFNYDDEVDFEDEYDSNLGESVEDPLAGRSPDKFLVPEEEVGAVIQKIANNYINLVTNERTTNGRQNVEFMNQHNLTEDNVRELAKQLTTADYSYSSNSRNVNRAGNVLTFFVTEKDFTLSDGRTFEGLKVYVKVDATDDGLVTAVSFHTGSGNVQHPYENNSH